MSAKEVDALLKARLKETKTISHKEVRRRVNALIEGIRKKKVAASNRPPKSSLIAMESKLGRDVAVEVE